jgi:hypothetical protein
MNEVRRRNACGMNDDMPNPPKSFHLTSGLGIISTRAHSSEPIYPADRTAIIHEVSSPSRLHLFC